MSDVDAPSRGRQALRYGWPSSREASMPVTPPSPADMMMVSGWTLHVNRVSCHTTNCCSAKTNEELLSFSHHGEAS